MTVLSEPAPNNSISSKISEISAGYKNYDKKRIKWGMLYQSGKIDSLDNESIQRMKNLKIKT